MEKGSSIVSAISPGGPLAPLFTDQASWANWRCFLKGLYGLEMSAQEQSVFELCTGRKTRPESGYAEGWCVVGRRGGKSRMSATVALYEATLGSHAEGRLRGDGEKWIHILACDKSQAGIILGYIRAGLGLFPGLIKSQTLEEIHLNNGIAIGVKAATRRGTRGYTTICLICDEAASWRDLETMANPMNEIMAAILPGLVPGGKLLVISTPLGKLGTFYETFKDFYGVEDSDVLVWQASSRFMNPSLHEGLIKRLLSRSHLMRSEFDASFREDITSLYPEALIDAAMDHGETPAVSGVRYMAFVDPSGGASDSMTLAIGHRAGDEIWVDKIAEKAPPFSTEEVVAEFASYMKAYGVITATSDRYGGIWPVDAFRKQGIIIETSALTASDIYLEGIALLNSGRLHLPKNDRLKLQLQLLERHTAPGGRDKVVHPQGAHDDLANATVGCAGLAQRERPWTPREQEARLPVVEHMAASLENPKSKEKRDAIEDFLDDLYAEPGARRIVRKPRV